ncbi:PaaI family thioesterase [Limosilactobacillus caccae]|jgi:uncharacterized protein (TIGR00369 family)|uniref:PaaI family thioesterase n=1 Tax=Limosilactobacillus caccae TaxID=1926284 RepID=UPI00097032B5|nr:PaaI family thioesterase [Limosilactobacillus caccae]
MNLLENLGIHPQSVSATEAIVTVEVTDKLMQPYGVVHGGINATLAETAASLGANKWLAEQNQAQIALGVNITTDHLLPVSNDKIKAVATPLKQGRTLQTWLVKLYNQKRLTSTSIVTLANRPRPASK